MSIIERDPGVMGYVWGLTVRLWGLWIVVSYVVIHGFWIGEGDDLQILASLTAYSLILIFVFIIYPGKYPFSGLLGKSSKVRSFVSVVRGMHCKVSNLFCGFVVTDSNRLIIYYYSVVDKVFEDDPKHVIASINLDDIDDCESGDSIIPEYSYARIDCSLGSFVVHDENASKICTRILLDNM